jgi:UDP-N-acetylglucosamine 2-epimerase (non-hydrolysing)
MVDTLMRSLEHARLRTVHRDLALPADYGLVTLHRPALVDNPERLGEVMATLHEVAAMTPLVFPVHPRTRRVLEQAGVRADPSLVKLIEPLGYLDFLALQAGAALVLTDSGGVQEETSVLGVPCLTLRENTERPITVTNGTNTLVGFDPDAILRAARAAVAERRTVETIPLWDGRTAERIVAVLSQPVPEPRFIPPSLIADPSDEFASRHPLVRP